MPSWIEQSAHRGLLTSRYPRVPASDAEVPTTARAPLAGPEGGAAGPGPDRCPVGAIEGVAVDQGRCIRCARCLADGFRFAGAVESSSPSRAALARPAAPDAGPDPRRAPLAGLGRSLHLFLVDVGSCNACNLELLALANPLYDASRLGLFFTNSPRHADVLVIVGAPTEEMAEPLRRAYEAMPGPKAVVVLGACGISGGAFRGNPGLRAGCDELVPVDLYVPGCPPTPVQVLDGILSLAGRGRGDR